MTLFRSEINNVSHTIGHRVLKKNFTELTLLAKTTH